MNLRKHCDRLWTMAVFLPLFSVIVLTAMDSAGAKDFEWEEGNIKPVWLNGGGDSTLGLSFKGRGAFTGSLGKASVGIEGTLALDEEANPHPIAADLKWVGIYDFYTPPKTETKGVFGDPDEEMDSGSRTAGLNKTGKDKPPAGDHDTIEYGIGARFETDQAGDNYGWALGVEAAYIAVTDISPQWPLNISGYADFEWVDVVESETLQNLGINEKDYTRVRAAVALKYKVGEYFQQDVFQRISLHGDLRYYQDLNAPDAVADAGLDTDLYWAGAISYDLADKNWLFDAVFLRISGGRIPPETRDDTTLFLGLVVNYAE